MIRLRLRKVLVIAISLMMVLLPGCKKIWTFEKSPGEIHADSHSGYQNQEWPKSVADIQDPVALYREFHKRSVMENRMSGGGEGTAARFRTPEFVHIIDFMETSVQKKPEIPGATQLLMTLKDLKKNPTYLETIKTVFTFANLVSQDKDIDEEYDIDFRMKDILAFAEKMAPHAFFYVTIGPIDFVPFVLWRGLPLYIVEITQTPQVVDGSYYTVPMFILHDFNHGLGMCEADSSNKMPLWSPFSIAKVPCIAGAASKSVRLFTQFEDSVFANLAKDFARRKALLERIEASPPARREWLLKIAFIAWHESINTAGSLAALIHELERQPERLEEKVLFRMVVAMRSQEAAAALQKGSKLVRPFISDPTPEERTKVDTPENRAAIKSAMVELKNICKSLGE